MLKLNDNTLSAGYGLWTDGITLSGNGTSDYPIGVVGGTLHRYEKFLGSGISAGTLNAAPSSFNEMIIGVGWNQLGTNHTVTEKQYYTTNINSNNDYHFCNFFIQNNTIYWQQGTIYIPASGGSWITQVPYRLQKTISNTAERFTTTTSTYRQSNYVEIYGVKYL